MNTRKFAPLAAGIMMALLATTVNAGDGDKSKHANTTAEQSKSGAIDRNDGVLTANEVAERSTDSAPTQSSGPTHGKSDAHFAQMIASGGMMEVKLGQMAQQKGQSAEVKAYGKKMVDDHTRNNAELKALATTKGLELPAEPLPEEAAAIKRFDKLSGAEFDRAYIMEMVDSHAKMERLLTETTEKAGDADLKKFAEKTLGPVREHETHAKRLDAGSDNSAVAKDGDDNTDAQ